MAEVEGAYVWGGWVMRELELSVVVPAYNERACIERVVQTWLRELSTLRISFVLTVLDDGSTDGMEEALSPFEHDARVRVIRKPNSGHGPTILVGYATACREAEWVFQCDADDEMPAGAFPDLWEKREGYDALFGYREARVQTIGRRVISAASRLIVGLLYGHSVRDVNTPYRLIRSTVLEPLIAVIPADTFAPNVTISGGIALAELRVLNVPVEHQHRRTGSVSIMRWRLWKSALRAAWQTVRIRPSLGRVARRMAEQS